jgi:hypothetical protein
VQTANWIFVVEFLEATACQAVNAFVVSGYGKKFFSTSLFFLMLRTRSITGNQFDADPDPFSL